MNVPDTTIIKLYVDDEPFFLPTARLQDYGRILDMRAGTLTRELVWATGAGKHVRIRSCRMVSLEYRHLVAMTYEVTMLDEPAPAVVSSLVLNRQDARQTNDLPEHRPGDPRLVTVLPHRVLNGLSLARGSQARHARAAGGTGAQPSPAAFQLGLLISSGAGRARPGPHRSCGLRLGRSAACGGMLLR